MSDDASTRDSTQKAGGGFTSFFDKITDAVKDIKTTLSKEVAAEIHGNSRSQHRYSSFAEPRDGNNVKWYVDGCGYFWAVSVALEQARESIWILDWWLSPELHLRRPAAGNEQYRLDRMLQAAAQRGVKINIIVYKEVAAALTRTLLNPIFPDSYSSSTSWSKSSGFLERAGYPMYSQIIQQFQKENPLIKSSIIVDSLHTKHALEALHPNIAVFRHPDHTPDARTLQSSFLSSFQNLKLDASNVAKLPLDALQGLYGITEGTILYWAHHEKLCLIDSSIAFMGGLDMCFGRWDANQHSIADVHPGDLNAIVWPGQDYNNCRLMDFVDVSKWEENKLDRKNSSRAGWSDVSIGIRGPVVRDLQEHFAQRWNFIYKAKYYSREDTRYLPLVLGCKLGGDFDQSQNDTKLKGHHNYIKRFGHEGKHMKAHLQEYLHQAEEDYLGIDHLPPRVAQGPRICQLVRSVSTWSHGVNTEKSIANAYVTLIRQANHFIYIENQFFITITGTGNSSVKNTIGAAIVERIIRAAESGQKFKIIVVIPAIPGFAGDLKAESSLGTRAIMEFQYDSINRGGHSIMEELKKAGHEPLDYIRFYNLRNYDKINASSVMKDVETKSGVDYEAARRDFDDQLGCYQGVAEERVYGQPKNQDYSKYQRAAKRIDERSGLGNTRWDSVAECYMLNGPDIRDIPWEKGDTEEIDAFVSEELYVHTKVMIADDRIVVCGSANLNDRSQLGYHDSEIAMVIEDSEHIDSYMNGHPYRVSKFAASLRRQLMRKHLGLILPQTINRPDQNFMPPGSNNEYDFGSTEDNLVADPLASGFIDFWNGRAKSNTAAFSKVFHAIPDDRVRTWKHYEEYYQKYFHDAEGVPNGKKPSEQAQNQWGHVVKQEFSPGPEGVKEVKEVLSTIKGNLVEMPLQFLLDEDIAETGLTLNAFTEEIYT